MALHNRFSSFSSQSFLAAAALILFRQSLWQAAPLGEGDNFVDGIVDNG